MRSYFLLYSPIFWGSPTFLLYFRVISYILLYFRLHMIIYYLIAQNRVCLIIQIHIMLIFVVFKIVFSCFFFQFCFHFSGSFVLYWIFINYYGFSDKKSLAPSALTYLRATLKCRLASSTLWCSLIIVLVCYEVPI